MANTARVAGFKPVKALTGGAWTSLIRKYEKDASASALYIGDVVNLEADGKVTQAATNDKMLGVVVAVGEDLTTFGETGYFNPNDLGKRFLAATEAGAVGVVPAEGSIFEVFDDGTDLDLVVGGLADIAVAQGSTITGNSAYTITTSVNGDVMVVEQATNPDNDPSLANARYLVKFQDNQNAIN